LRFFFTVTLDRPDLARWLTIVPYPRRASAKRRFYPLVGWRFARDLCEVA